jgi:hypothetical protein
MLRVLVILLIAAMAMLPQPAPRYGWRWTYWDMPESAFRASAGGRLGPTRPFEARLNLEPHLFAEMPVIQDGHEFIGHFAFDEDDRRLIAVTLTLKDYGHCPSLKSELRRHLGQTVNGEGLWTLIWNDDGDGNHLIYTEFPSRDGRKGLCRLMYHPGRIRD